MAFLETAFEELVPQMSPDSQHLAYQSNEEGRWEVFVIGFPNAEGKQKVSLSGGIHPRWSPQGDELFYIEGDTLMAVSVETVPSLRLGDAQPLFSGEPIGLQFNPANRPDFPNYNVGLDGQRFVAVQVAPGESGRATSIVVVQNWFEEFRPEN